MGEGGGGRGRVGEGGGGRGRVGEGGGGRGGGEGRKMSVNYNSQGVNSP